MEDSSFGYSARFISDLKQHLEILNSYLEKAHQFGFKIEAKIEEARVFGNKEPLIKIHLDGLWKNFLEIK